MSRAHRGIGYDSHRLAAGRRLILGGVEIPHEQGLDGHSDADVLTHAVIDALLGAAGLGDIGEHFPDTDERCRDADSIELLRGRGRARRAAPGCAIVNVDCTVVMEAPEARRRTASAIRAAPGRRARARAGARQRQGDDRRGDRLRRPRRGRRGARDRERSEPSG